MSILDHSNETHARADARLRTDTIVWLTTVDPEGQPQATPVWFLWDGESFLVYSRPSAPKLTNIAANPRVSLHLSDDGVGENIVILEGRAVLVEGPPADQVEPYIEKYREHIANYEWTPESFAADYSQAVRISPTRVRIW